MSIGHLRGHSLSFVFLAVLLLLGAWANQARAEEGGSGHYLPGSISSVLDGVSPTELFVLRLNGVYYDGSIGAAIPIAGVDAANVDVNSEAVGLTAFWRPSWGTISERWSYAMSATLPYVRVHVEGDVGVSALSTTVHREDTEYGLGDVVLFPVMLNFHATDDFNVNARLGVYAPTGDYEEGRLANTGKNYWTFEPILGLMYLGQKNGREVSLFFGADFNTENHATEYRSGTQLHIDGTVAQHFPIGKALLGLGVTGYWYQQVANDSGSGATFGAFKGRTNGVGPSLQYSQAFGSHNVVAELKWLHEWGVEKRPEGDFIILKAMMTF